MNPRRILVVDDHPVVIDGVRTLFADCPDLEVAGEAGELATALRLTEELQPDAVILDLRLQGRFAPETAGSLKAAAPRAKVLVHTSSEQNEPVYAALRAGADGAVFKDGRDLLPALRTLLDGGRRYVDARLRTAQGARRASAPGPDGAGVPVVDRLSPREYDILRALALGRSTREIATEFYLAESTVRGYTKGLLTKLGVRNRIEALAVARRAQLI